MHCIMNALYYSIIGQEIGSDNKATASRNGISNFLLCFFFEMDATLRPLQKKTSEHKRLLACRNLNARRGYY
jgi:hypothetical protein